MSATEGIEPIAIVLRAQRLAAKLSGNARIIILVFSFFVLLLTQAKTTDLLK